MKWKYSIILVLLINIIDRVSAGCTLSLKQDFGTPSPVFLHNGKFLAPNAKNSIVLRRSETLQVACPGNRKFVMFGNDTSNVDVVDIKCVLNSTFRAKKEEWVGTLKDVHCNEPPWYTAEKTRVECHGRHHIYRVGYKIRDVFFTLYEACFDSGLLNTLYVKHELTSANAYFQHAARPQFLEGDLFGKLRMSEVYKVEHQKGAVNRLLGPGTADRYISKSQALTRGHLAAKTDFSMAALQRASFHYINSAPQWRRGNAGDWAALEDGLRRRLQNYNSSVMVYTGTHGVSTLEDNNGTHKQLFLHLDENNNQIVPVPLYFYKLVHDPHIEAAAVFISINSPYYNTSTIDKLSFCDDICQGDKRYAWLRWRANDATHSFCCEYHQVAREFDSLPKLNVKRLFY